MNSFSKNVMTLVSGNAIALLLPIVFYPVLSRVYSPADYALFGLYFGVFSFLEIASVGRYDFAIVMPPRDKDAIALVAGGLLISACYSLVVSVLVFFFKDVLSSSLHNPDLANWLYFLPFTLFFVSIIKVCNAWLIRVKNFKATSINKVSQKFAEVGSQLLFGFFKASNGLIFGDFSGKILNTGFSIYQSIKSGLDKKFISKQTIKNNLLMYLEFPKYGILPSMLNTLGGMMPVFIISRYYSVEVSGSFNFSRIILSVPFALIASGISQVLMQQVSEKRHKGQSISSDLFQLTWKLCALSGLGTLIIFLAAPVLFDFIFGAKWRLSGEYTSILIFSYAISFVVSPFSVLLNVLGKIKWASYWQVFYFLLVSILWFFSDFRITHFLLVIVIMDVIAYLIYGFLIYKTVRYYENDLSPLLS